MRPFCFAAERGHEGACTELLPLPGGTLGARKGKTTVFKIQIDRRLESLHFKGSIVIASFGSIVNMQSPWPSGRLAGIQPDRVPPTLAADGPGAPTSRGHPYY